MKSKCTKSWIPNFRRVRTTVSILDLKISGYVCCCSSSWKDFSVYKRKHLPGLVLPALEKEYINILKMIESSV